MDVATRYKLLEKIGAGSFATVYRAQDQELGREVAVKQIESQFLADSSQFERYWKEATLLASFQHPHIVTIYDVVRGKGWLILELMQANLRDRMQGRPMDVKAVQTTLTQALRALSALHSRGLLHGDIKPSNLMIDHRKRIKVGDFGLARRVSHDDGSVIRGTAKYMAPETLSQEFGDVGPQSDLYSLGFTAYELLCGAKFETLFPGLDAFGRDRQAAWMMWHAALDRKLPAPGKALDNVPPALSKVIGKLVEKDPRKRYSSADEALEDLGAAPGEPLTRVSDGKKTEKATPARTKPRGIVIAAFAGSMLLSVAMLIPWGPGKAVATGPGAGPPAGIIRSIDVANRSLELVDPATGLPKEVSLSENTPIRLRAGGSDVELVLLKKLQAGDWVRGSSDGGQLKLDVSRPVTHEGRLAQVDALASKVTVSIENQRLRDKVTLIVPGSVKVLLNGKPAALKELLADDRVTVDHLLDPAGKQGEIASRLEAFRETQFSGTVSSFDPANGQLKVSGASPGSNWQTVVSPKTVVQFDDGSPATAADLKSDASIEVRGDAVARVIVVLRQPEKEGVLTAIDDAKRTLKIQIANEMIDVVVPPEASITLNGSPASLADLRAGNDRIAVGPRGTTVRATRIPRYDRRVLAIGCSTNRDRSIPVLEGAVEEARAVAEAAVQRYAAPSDWVQLLAEPTTSEVTAAVKSLGTLRANVQVVIALRAQAFTSAGQTVLTFSDSQSSATGTSGIPLQELLNSIDATPPEHKLVLLDVLHPRPGLEDTVPADAAAMLSKLSPLKSTVVLCPRPTSAAAPSSRFLPQVAKGFSGAADANRDLMATADELSQWFTSSGMAVERWPAP